MNRKERNDDRMTEGLSSFADSEVSAGSVGDWINLLANNEQARQRLARYRLVGAHLGGLEHEDALIGLVGWDQVAVDPPRLVSPAPKSWPFGVRDTLCAPPK